ncbi:MAG: thiolase family protein, partial [Chitinophagaceae bacterium]
MQEVVILSALRTPIGSFGGSLKELSATRLGAAVIQAVIQKAGLEAEAVNEVYMGSVLQANLGQAPARQAALFAGLPHHVACTTINKVCASGLKSIAIGAQQIMLGEAEVVVAGGMESMSNVPYYTDQARWGGKFGHSQLIDGLLKDGLTDVYNGEAMGMAAELCARECKISRQHQDEFAIASYQRSQQAWSKGWFKEEVVPVTLTSKKGQSQ